VNNPALTEFCFDMMGKAEWRHMTIPTTNNSFTESHVEPPTKLWSAWTRSDRGCASGGNLVTTFISSKPGLNNSAALGERCYSPLANREYQWHGPNASSTTTTIFSAWFFERPITISSHTWQDEWKFLIVQTTYNVMPTHGLTFVILEKN
jgi:hypothetical protein